MQQFKVSPKDLPAGNSKTHIKRLSENEAEFLAEFYNTQTVRTNGMIEKSADDFAQLLRRQSNRIFGFAEEGRLRGYIVCNFKKGSDESFLVNDMIINELLFDSPEVFAELMAFLKSQSDQIRYIIVNTQDEGFIYSLADPRNHTNRILFSVYQECCQTGLGIMYRITDVPMLFRELKNHRFGQLDISLSLKVSDSFVPENNKTFLLSFNKGLCSLAETGKADAELVIGIAELSSLICCAANLKQLVRYGKAHLSDLSLLESLNHAFAMDEKPLCMSHF